MQIGVYTNDEETDLALAEESCRAMVDLVPIE